MLKTIFIAMCSSFLFFQCVQNPFYRNLCSTSLLLYVQDPFYCIVFNFLFIAVFSSSLFYLCIFVFYSNYHHSNHNHYHWYHDQPTNHLHNTSPAYILNTRRYEIMTSRYLTGFNAMTWDFLVLFFKILDNWDVIS